MSRVAADETCFPPAPTMVAISSVVHVRFLLIRNNNNLSTGGIYRHVVAEFKDIMRRLFDVCEQCISNGIRYICNILLANIFKWLEVRFETDITADSLCIIRLTKNSTLFFMKILFILTALLVEAYSFRSFAILVASHTAYEK